MIHFKTQFPCDFLILKCLTEIKYIVGCRTLVISKGKGKTRLTYPKLEILVTEQELQYTEVHV